MKKINLFLFALLLLSVSAFAQYQPNKTTGSFLLGVGGGGLSGSGAIPIAVEYNFHNFTPEIQAGVMGAFASTSDDYGNGIVSGKWTYTYIVIAAQANYHFWPKKQIDPFAGLSLGYNIGSSSFKWNTATTFPAPSSTVGGFFYSFQAGVNYWFSPKWAGQIRLGYFPYVGVGVTAAL